MPNPWACWRCASTVLAAYETLLPLFDNDERRTILFLQHVVGAVARRPFEITFEALGNRAHPLNAIEAACCTEGLLYGSYYDIAFDRLDTGTFEMRHCDVRLGRQLDAGGRPYGPRAARRAPVADVAGRRRLPIPGGGHR
jgi:hypothetical protein